MWKTMKLGNIVKPVGGSGFPKKFQGNTEGEIPFFKVSDMNLPDNNKFMYLANNYVSRETLKEMKGKAYPAGTVIFPKIGGAISTNKKRILTTESAFDNNVMGLVPNEDITSEYLYWFFLNMDLYEISNKAALPSITAAAVKEIDIALPPLAEQQHIVAKLDAVFSEIDMAIRLVEEKLIQAQNLRDSSIVKIFDENLIGAENYILDEVVSRLTNGYVGATKNIYQEDGIPYLLARHVKNNTLTFDGKTFVSNQFNEKNKKSILKQDDVLLVQSGHIGHTAVVPKEHEGHNCHAMIVMTTVKEILTGEYLSALFNSRTYKSKLLNLRTGSTVPHLNCGDVKKVKIPVPKKETQDKIVCLAKSVTESFMEIESLLANKIQLLTMLRTSILAQELKPSEAA